MPIIRGPGDYRAPMPRDRRSARRLLQQLTIQLQQATGYALLTQDGRGAWQTDPEPRVFDTALVTYSMSRAPEVDNRGANAVGRATAWLKSAPLQGHDPAARALEAAARGLISTRGEPIVLHQSLLSGVLGRKALFLLALAHDAGLRVWSSATLDEVLEQLTQKLRAKQDKRWARTDTLAAYLLVVPGTGVHASAISAALAQLKTLQELDGSFSYNPVSTALAFRALTRYAPGTPAWRRCREYLLRTQQSDGTWRFCIGDIWDTSVMLRTFRHVPGFAEAAEGAARFLASAQNADGGWGFRNSVESDNDTTSSVLLALRPFDVAPTVPTRAFDYLRGQQLPDGLWRTWQASEDPPVEDVVAHVVTALDAYTGEHTIPLDDARHWLIERYHARDGVFTASWYRNQAYSVVEIAAALGLEHPVSRAAITKLCAQQNADGGFPLMPGEESSASATGLMVTAMMRADVIDDALWRAVGFLLDTQQEDGTWHGRLEMYGPRPLLCHFQLHTHAFASMGLIQAWRWLSTSADR